MHLKRSTRIRALASGVVIAAAVCLSATPSAAANSVRPDGVMSGDSCANNTQSTSASYPVVSIPGAKACIRAVQEGSNKPAVYQYIVADTRADGHSARVDVSIQQGTTRRGTSTVDWVETSRHWVIDSSGYKTSRISTADTIYKRAGTDMLRLRVRSCTYESGSDLFVACGSWTTVGLRPWVWPTIL